MQLGVSAARHTAEQSAAGIQKEDRDPRDAADLASSTCTAQTSAPQTWLGTQDCSAQAACIAAALETRTSAEAGPAHMADSASARKRSRTVFEYGNYRGYYGYRLGDGEDPRLQVNLAAI